MLRFRNGRRQSAAENFSRPDIYASMRTYAHSPMTRARLAEFDFCSIQFTVDGQASIGFISHHPGQETFNIVYTALDGSVERRRILFLTDEMISRIEYDATAEILTLR